MSRDGASVAVRSAPHRLIPQADHLSRADAEALAKRVLALSRADLARVAPEDPEAMPELPPQQYQEAQGWSAPTAALDPAGRAAAVLRVTEPCRTESLSATGYIESNAGVLAVANTRGL